MKNETKYLYFLTLLYFAISFIGILHHELWLDESHHWLLSRDSNSLLDLIRNTRYEGHPILWNILLFIITRFTSNPFWMQFLHISIATATVFLFLRNAPFSWIFKTLFIFGYFMIFEYSIISRNYILGILFLFFACSIFKERRSNFILFCFCLALAANVHLIFGVIAFALFLLILFENFEEGQLFSNRIYNIGYLIFVVGLLLAVVQIVPPDDTRFFLRVHEIPLNERFTKGFISFFKGLITIPDFTSIHFWNSNLIVNLSKPLSGIFGILVYFVPLLLFYKNRKTLIFVYTALIGTQVFFIITQMSATRYDGMTYFIIIVALWIEHSYAENVTHKSVMHLKMDAVKKPFVIGILIIQLFSGVYAYSMDFRYSFCVAKNVVDYLKQEKLNTRKIVSVTCDGTLISPFLEKKIFFLCDGSYQSYCHWDFGCATDISESQIVNMLTDYVKINHNAVYVSNYSIVALPRINSWQRLNDKLKVRFLKKFEKSIVRNADYYVFEVENIKP